MDINNEEDTYLNLLERFFSQGRRIVMIRQNGTKNVISVAQLKLLI